MTALFTAVLNMSITASFVALGVIVIRLFIKKAPKVFSYMLWLAVLFRLVCPFSFDSVLSVFTIFKSDIQTQTGAVAFVLQSAVDAAAPAVNAAGGDMNLAGSAVSSVPSSHSLLPTVTEIASVIWFIGIAAFLIGSFVSYMNVKSRIKTAVRIKDNVFETDRISSPFLFGLLKPRIYVPAGLKEEDMAYILAHEQVHIQRRDYFIKPFAFLVLILHWFNPVIWLSFALMSKDMEMSCDETVMRKLGISAKGGYSNSLLSLSIKTSGLTGAVAFGENNIKARIKNIVNYKKPTLWLVMLAIVLTVSLLVAFTSNPKPVAEGANAVETSQIEKTTDSVSTTVTAAAATKSPYKPIQNVTMSENQVTLKNGKKVGVKVILDSGKYYTMNDVGLGGDTYDENYKGTYHIEVYDPNTMQSISMYKNLVQNFYGEPMNFGGKFTLAFDDYNNDGNPDFTIGQYGCSSNFNLFHLYTINQNGIISLLTPDRFLISGYEQPFSAQLHKISKTSFSIECYDNSVGKTRKRIYQWKDGKFEITDQNYIDDINIKH